MPRVYVSVAAGEDDQRVKWRARTARRSRAKAPPLGHGYAALGEPGEPLFQLGLDERAVRLLGGDGGGPRAYEKVEVKLPSRVEASSARRASRRVMKLFGLYLNGDSRFN